MGLGLIKSDGFGNDPTDDKTNGRFVELIRNSYSAALAALGITVPTTKTLTGTSGSKTYSAEAFTVNQSGTAGFIGKLVNLTLTAVGSGAKLFFDYQVGGASRFKADTDGNVTAAGNIIASAAGKGLQVKEGSNARMGTLTLVAGTVTVANTSVTANTRIFLSKITNGGTAGELTITRSAGVSFTVTSSSNTETSTFDYLLVEPAA